MRLARPLVLALLLAACSSSPAMQLLPGPNDRLDAAVVRSDPDKLEIALSRPAYVALVLGDDRDPRGPRLILADTGNASPRPRGEQTLRPTDLAAYVRALHEPNRSTYVLLLASTEPFSPALRPHDGSYLFPPETPRLTELSMVLSKVDEQQFAGRDDDSVALVIEYLLFGGQRLMPSQRGSERR